MESVLDDCLAQFSSKNVLKEEQHQAVLGLLRLVAYEQALLFGRAKRVSRQRASELRSREGPSKGELAAISHKLSFVLRPDEGKYHWLKNDVPEIKVD